MAKLFTKNDPVWADEVLIDDPLYDITESDDTPIHSDVKISLATEVGEAGTSLTAARMNNVEDGLDAVDDAVNVEGHDAKTTPVDADEVNLWDSIASAWKSLSWANIKATLKTYLDTLYLALVAPGTSGNVLTSNGTIWTSAAPTGGGGGASTPPGRLTLESGVPVSTTDQVDKTTLYYTPYVGNQIMLYDGVSSWDTVTFSELSLNISAFAASKPYDIWVYNNAGTATLDSTVWTNATTRATALAYQDGRLVKSGATTRLYLGTIYMDAASKCQDTLLKRYVWNYYNRVLIPGRVVEDETWTYATNTWRIINNTATNLVDFIIGVSEETIKSTYSISMGADTTEVGYISIGLDATDTQAANASASKAYISGVGFINYCTCTFNGLVSAGKHYLAPIEKVEVGTISYQGGAPQLSLFEVVING